MFKARLRIVYGGIAGSSFVALVEAASSAPLSDLHLISTVLFAVALPLSIVYFHLPIGWTEQDGGPGTTSENARWERASYVALFAFLIAIVLLLLSISWAPAVAFLLMSIYATRVLLLGVKWVERSQGEHDTREAGNKRA